MAQNKRRKKRKVFSPIYLTLVLIILYLPILMVIIYSFNSGRTIGSWQGFTTSWYSRLFSNALMADALKNSLVLAVVSSLLAGGIGENISSKLVYTVAALHFRPNLVGACLNVIINLLFPQTGALIVVIAFLHYIDFFSGGLLGTVGQFFKSVLPVILSSAHAHFIDLAVVFHGLFAQFVQAIWAKAKGFTHAKSENAPNQCHTLVCCSTQFNFAAAFGIAVQRHPHLSGADTVQTALQFPDGLCTAVFINDSADFFFKIARRRSYAIYAILANAKPLMQSHD